MFKKILTVMAISLPTLAPVQAQDAWPNKPVKIIVSQAAGSSTDIVARGFADALSKTYKQPFVIFNRDGANGMIATESVAKAPKDGYTLLFTYAGAQVVNQSLYPKVGYDGAKDFAAIAQVGASGNFLVVQPSMPVKDLTEFIAYAKTKPADDMAYGSWGNGSGGHLSMEGLKQKTGLKMRHIPYKNSSAVGMDLMGGQLQVAFVAPGVALPLVKAGKLKALAISGNVRSGELPDVKTMTEQGVPFNLTAWYGLFAPAGTPSAIVHALNKEVNKLIANPDMAEQWKTLAFTEMPIKTPEQFAETVKRDIQEWGTVVRTGHITID